MILIKTNAFFKSEIQRLKFSEEQEEFSLWSAFKQCLTTLLTACAASTTANSSVDFFLQTLIKGKIWMTKSAF